VACCVAKKKVANDRAARDNVVLQDDPVPGAHSVSPNPVKGDKYGALPQSASADYDRGESALRAAAHAPDTSYSSADFLDSDLPQAADTNYSSAAFVAGDLPKVEAYGESSLVDRE